MRAPFFGWDGLAWRLVVMAAFAALFVLAGDTFLGGAAIGAVVGLAIHNVASIACRAANCGGCGKTLPPTLCGPCHDEICDGCPRHR